MAASSKGEQRKALAAWDRWWSEKITRERGMSRCDTSVSAIHILSRSQVIIDSRKTFQDAGYVWRTVCRIRSSLRNGFSKYTTWSRSAPRMPPASRQ